MEPFHGHRQGGDEGEWKGRMMEDVFKIGGAGWWRRGWNMMFQLGHWSSWDSCVDASDRKPSSDELKQKENFLAQVIKLAQEQSQSLGPQMSLPSLEVHEKASHQEEGLPVLRMGTGGVALQMGPPRGRVVASVKDWPVGGQEAGVLGADHGAQRTGREYLLPSPEGWRVREAQKDVTGPEAVRRLAMFYCRCRRWRWACRDSREAAWWPSGQRLCLSGSRRLPFAATQAFFPSG